jgi:hypothetical protein
VLEIVFTWHGVSINREYYAKKSGIGVPLWTSSKRPKVAPPIDPGLNPNVRFCRNTIPETHAVAAFA